MKSYHHTIQLGILLIFTLILGQSCCTPLDYKSADEVTQIQFIGFDYFSMDTTIIEVFNSQNLTRIDSYSVRGYWQDPIENRLIDLKNPINPNYRYRITPLPYNKRYIIDGITIGEKICNSCYNTTEIVEVVTSYRVNGYRMYFEDIQVPKFPPEVTEN